jgi:hypothetical protein
MHDKAGIDRLLARVLGIQRRQLSARRHRRGASAARDHAHARRRRIDVQAASRLEWLHEFTQERFILGFYDQVHRVCALDDRFTLDPHAKFPDIRTAQMIEEARAEKRVLRGTAVW